VLRYDNGNFIHNPIAYLNAQENFQNGYCKKIIEVGQFQLGKDKCSGLADHSDTIGRTYLNTALFISNEDYITKSLYLRTLVGNLPKSVDDRATKGDLLKDMHRNHYRSVFYHPELTPLIIGKYLLLFQNGVLSEEELTEFKFGEWVNNDILPREKDAKQNMTKGVLREWHSNAWGLDKLLVAPGRLELNKNHKSQARRFNFGVVESVNHFHKEHDHQYPDEVFLVYHVPLKKGRVMSQVCVLMVDDLSDFTSLLFARSNKSCSTKQLFHAVLSLFIQRIYAKT
jgi:hypothetical protein